MTQDTLHAPGQPPDIDILGVYVKGARCSVGIA